MAKTLPRISNLYNEFNTVISRMEYLFDSPKKLQQRSKDQLWDIYRLLLTALNKIEAVCGTPPADILEHIKTNDVDSTTSTDTVITDDSDTSQDVYEILCNTEDYAIATYGIGEELKDQMTKLSDQIENIRCLVKDDYPVIQRTPNISSEDIYNLVVSTITDCMQHIAINIKHTETKSESIHIIEKHY